MSLKVACLGAGYFSQFHYGSWARMPEVTVVGACDLDFERAEATGVPAFEDLEAMLAATAPDVLDIILPPPSHYASIKLALDHGVRTIICQKPFCQSLGEAEDIAAQAEAAGVRLVIHENFRFMPWYRRMKSLIDEGVLGTVQQLTFRLRPGDGQGPRAYLDRQPYFQTMPEFLIHETGVHWIDTFRYLLGDPTAVYADLRRVNPVIAGEDAGYAIFDHPGGARSVFDGNRLLDHASDNHRRTMGEALVEGLEGTLTLGGDGSVTLRRFGETGTRTMLDPDSFDGFGGDCVHHLQCHVVSALLHGTPFENEARDYLNVIRIKDVIYRSAKTGTKQFLSGT